MGERCQKFYVEKIGINGGKNELLKACRGALILWLRACEKHLFRTKKGYGLIALAHFLKLIFSETLDEFCVLNPHLQMEKRCFLGVRVFKDLMSLGEAFKSITINQHQSTSIEIKALLLSNALKRKH